MSKEQLSQEAIDIAYQFDQAMEQLPWFCRDHMIHELTLTNGSAVVRLSTFDDPSDRWDCAMDTCALRLTPKDKS